MPVAPAPAPAAEPAPAPLPPIDVHAWAHIGSQLSTNNVAKAKKDRLTEDGDMELHLDGAVTKNIGLTANIKGSFGSGTNNGSVTILDLIARFDIDDAFHVWAGRMLVPSDRANFSGYWFAAPWYYAGTFGSGFAGPAEGPSGRNDGVTIWGQAEGGLFKYYVSAFDLYDTKGSPLFSGRLNLALINPEPGYYHSSTYYGGKDILAIGIGGQMKHNGSASEAGVAGGVLDDYAELNADVLFEKNLKESGVIDVEAAFYKYQGKYQLDYSWLGLVSWLTPDKVGPGKIQPLVRVQQAAPQVGDTQSSVEVQAGYVIADYAARLALGYQHTWLASKGGGPLGADAIEGNNVYLGVQLLK
ncbi:MAG TPA: hypothetical protein VF331_04505 [Polyangiales bacterium]